MADGTGAPQGGDEGWATPCAPAHAGRTGRLRCSLLLRDLSPTRPRMRFDSQSMSKQTAWALRQSFSTRGEGSRCGPGPSTARHEAGVVCSTEKHLKSLVAAADERHSPRDCEQARQPGAQAVLAAACTFTALLRGDWRLASLSNISDHANAQAGSPGSASRAMT